MCYVGPEVNHIKQSRGGDCDIFSHYATSYAASYKQHLKNFTSSTCSYYGSGFVSNTRPVLHYTSFLDEKDNPAIKAVLDYNYLTTTHKDFTPFATPSGKELLPCLKRPSNKKNQEENFFSAEGMLNYQKLNDILTPVMPKVKPLLHSEKGLWDVEDENFGHGPGCYSTTYSTHYCNAKSRSNDPAITSVGRKEESGSTRNINNFDAVNNRFVHSYVTVEPRWKTDRNTGQTVYMDDFRPYLYKNGSEALPRWMGNLSCQKPNSYVLQNKLWPEYKTIHPRNVYDQAKDMSEERLEKLRKEDPAEYQNAVSAFIEPSMSKGVHNGLQEQPKSLAERLGSVTVGKVEPSGSALNLSGNIQTRDMPPDRFITHNMTQYYAPPPGQDAGDREGHIHFNTQPSKETQISRSAKLSYFEAQEPSTDKLHAFTPYQSKSIQARDTLPIPPTKSII